MRRLANGTQVAALPTALAALGTPGFASRGDPAGGQEASVFDADQYNRIQEELVAPILAAGIALDGNNNAQLLAALRTLFAPHRSYFRANGTFITPAGVTSVLVRIWGAGGGGGGSWGPGSSGAGGGGGGYAEGVLAAVPGQSVAITVGKGGAGGTNGTTPGTGGSGGASSYGSNFGALGGGGGTGGTSGPGSTAGGGGAGYGLPLLITGSGGGIGQTYDNGAPAGGFGGAAWGGARAGPNLGTSGHNGAFPGAGGSGGAQGGVGGMGNDGLVIVEW
ncbi:MAG TPA: hypothetical protein VNZ61_08685 [Roseomonas sp.]|nr:hypothetical protein [Roseomonas sp.]